MQAQAYEGYFKNGLFHTGGRIIRIPEEQHIFITVLNKPVHDNTDNITQQTLWEEVKGLYGIVRSDIDEKAELAEARAEKYARFN